MIIPRFILTMITVAAVCLSAVAQDDPISMDRGSWMIEGAEAPEGNVLRLHAENPGFGSGNFKQTVVVPVTDVGIEPGEYRVEFTANLLQAPSLVWIGLRGTDGSPSSFRNTLGGEDWNVLPLGIWSKFIGTLVVRGDEWWSGTLEFEVLMYGGNNDPMVESEILIAGVSLKNAAGEEMLQEGHVTFASDPVGGEPTLAKVGTDLKEGQSGVAKAEIVEAAP